LTLEYLRDTRPLSGTVLAVFERSAYLDLAGRVIAVTAGAGGRGPLAVGLSDLAPLRPLAAGSPVLLDAGCLWIGRGVVTLEDTPIWDPTLPAFTEAPRCYATQMAIVIDALRHGAPAGSAAPLLEPPVEDAAWSRHPMLTVFGTGLEALAGGFREGGDQSCVAAAVASIAGLGHGLTPSGDDLLTGILHALTVWPALAGRRGLGATRRLIADTARPRTTRISAAHLAVAADGHATEPWHLLIPALRHPSHALRSAVAALLRVGETSGADGLTGFCWAWQRLN
jgi:hypothetical protein